MANSDYTILVVDDDENNLDMLSRRLERKEYKVLTASDGPDPREEKKSGGDPSLDTMVLTDIPLDEGAQQGAGVAQRSWRGWGTTSIESARRRMRAGTGPVSGCGNSPMSSPSPLRKAERSRIVPSPSSDRNCPLPKP